MKTKEQIYITAPMLSQMLGVSNGFAYKMIREMNQELRQQGLLTISGKIPRAFFNRKWYGMNEAVGENAGDVVK